jgi:gliding motility-associated-like protein
VTDENGCTAEASVELVVENIVCDADHIFLPNTFTPNGDRTNDVWRLRSNFLDELIEVELIVFNRWGQRVFQATTTAQAEQGWDGTFGGRELPPDVYGFYLRVICPDREILERRGNVTLLR